jgi:hypothetical protein
MATGDITPYNDAAFSVAGAVLHQVAAQATPPLINAGEPVGKTLGTNTQYVISLATSGPTTSVQMAGISTTSSSETATLDGTVAVTPWAPGQIWLVAPKVAATWSTQTLYNALVGSRVTLDKTAGVYTINSADSSTNGLVVENLNITQYPSKVAFSVRTEAVYTY